MTYLAITRRFIPNMRIVEPGEAKLTDFDITSTLEPRLIIPLRIMGNLLENLTGIYRLNIKNYTIINLIYNFCSVFLFIESLYLVVS